MFPGKVPSVITETVPATGQELPQPWAETGMESNHDESVLELEEQDVTWQTQLAAAAEIYEEPIIKKKQSHMKRSMEDCGQMCLGQVTGVTRELSRNLRLSSLSSQNQMFIRAQL